MKPNKSLAQWISLFLVGFSLIVAYKMFDSLAQIGSMFGTFFSILTPFIIGFVIAFVLYVPARTVEDFFLKRKAKFFHVIARPVSIAAAYLLLIAILTVVVWMLIPGLTEGINSLVKDLDGYIQVVIDFVEANTKDGGVLAWFPLQETWDALQDWVKNVLKPENILGYMQGFLNFTTSLVDVVLAIVESVYMLLGRESLFRAVRSFTGLFLKEETQDIIADYLRKIAKIFYNYVYSQLLDALVVGVLASIGFVIIGLPHPIALGIMLGITNLIPYFGALIGGCVVVLITLLSGNFYSALFVAIYILAMQQVDANIIQPRIVGQTVGLKAIYVLLGITVFGGLFGFVGVLLGPPSMAVVQLLVADMINKKRLKNQSKQTINVSEE